MALYEILFRFRPDGTLRGSHVIEWGDDGKSAGSARPFTQADMDAIGGLIPLGYEQRIAELKAEIEDLKTKHAEELEAQSERGRRQARREKLAAAAKLAAEEQPELAASLKKALILEEAGADDLAAEELRAAAGKAKGRAKKALDALAS